MIKKAIKSNKSGLSLAAKKSNSLSAVKNQRIPIGSNQISKSIVPGSKNISVKANKTDKLKTSTAKVIFTANKKIIKGDKAGVKKRIVPPAGEIPKPVIAETTKSDSLKKSKKKGSGKQKSKKQKSGNVKSKKEKKTVKKKLWKSEKKARKLKKEIKRTKKKKDQKKKLKAMKKKLIGVLKQMKYNRKKLKKDKK